MMKKAPTVHLQKPHFPGGKEVDIWVDTRENFIASVTTFLLWIEVEIYNISMPCNKVQGYADSYEAYVPNPPQHPLVL